MRWWRVEGSTQVSKEHNLNQQQDLDLGHKFNTMNSETEICKGYGWVVLGQETNMAVDYGMKAKTLELRGNSELDGIPEALITK